MDSPGWPVSVLKQRTSQNKDAVVFADNANYQRVFDLGLDGNKYTTSNTSGNTSGYGWSVQDGTNGQESQVILERVFAFNCADSGIYLGKNRRANKVLNCVSNYSLNRDGITVAGSDNTIQGCIFGSNAHAGICLGTTTSLRWSQFAGNSASAVTHVFNNDIYQNLVGISVASGSWGSLLMGNGIDRNSNEGISVWSGYDTSIQMNCFHSNGIAMDNTYPHVGLGSGVTQIAISGNDFGPQDGNESNKANYCVFKSGGIGATTVVGDYGTENTAGGTPNVTSAHNFHN
jgi:parallel beta-helix repeat protein